MTQFYITSRPSALVTSGNNASISGNLAVVGTVSVGNVALSSNASTLTIGGNISTGSVTIGNIALTSNATTLTIGGNISASFITGNGSGLTGISSAVTIASVAITDSSGTLLDDTALGTESYLTIQGSGFGAGAIVLLGSVAASMTNAISQSQLRARFVGVTPGTYSVFVVNTDGTSAVLASAVTWSDYPIWSTTSLAPATKTRSLSRNLAATGDSNIAYTASSTPPGTTLSTSGILTGTITEFSNTTSTYSFTVQATDAQLQNTPATFSLSTGFLKNFSGNANVIISNSTYAPYNTYNATAIEPAGGYVKIIADASSFFPTSNLLVNNVAPITSTYISSTELRAQIAPASNNTISNIEIINTDGSILSNGSLAYYTPPVWVTSTLAEVYKGVPFTNQLEAGGAMSYANISVFPAGVSLVQNMTFSITVTNDGSGNIFVVDGANKPILNLVRGGIYTFLQNDASNSTHPIAFKDSGGNAYLTGITSTGTPGNAGAQTVFAVANDAPSDLRYYCIVHGNGMGNTISVSAGNLSGNISDTPTVDSVYSLGIDALNQYNQNASRTFSLNALAFATRKLMASDKAADDQFGQSVSFSGDGTRLVVGAVYSDPGGTSDAGAAYVFSRSGTTWTQESKLQASDKAASDYFGVSVSINNDGTRLVVGAHYSNPGGTGDAGAAYVYSRSGTIWTQESKIQASDKITSDYFGQSVSISNDGTRLVVGAYLSDPGGTGDAGAAYVYSRSGTIWTQETKLQASDKAASDYFGVSVLINNDGTRLVVGAHYSDPGGTGNAGAAYVYSRSGTIWIQETKLFASDKITSDYFGQSVSISNDGTRLVVGAVNSDPGGTADAGAAYVYSRSGTTWTQETKIQASDKVANDRFGQSVSINNDGTRLVVGALLSDPGGTGDAGAAYVYSRSGTTWSQETKIQAIDKAANDQFGLSVSINNDGTQLVVGARYSDPGGTVDAGAAYVFSRSGNVWTTAM